MSLRQLHGIRDNNIGLIEFEFLSPSGAVPEGGGSAGGARPPLFAPNSLKSPQNWPKKCLEQAPETTAPPPFSNPGSAPVLYHVNHFYFNANY